MIVFLAVFSFLGIFLLIFLVYLLRKINKLVNQFESANQKIGSFKESINVIGKSVDVFRSIFGTTRKSKE
jgi:predicted PurR-regulated permease PerM|tara:strand:+ start:5577 stop:5786 length:210 start_codon:yes stop_codon:yes gene_type:complete